ncbi:MAG: hypothetical protein WBX06_03285, partial [Acidobacteriaceae bacterium]
PKAEQANTAGKSNKKALNRTARIPLEPPKACKPSPFRGRSDAAPGAVCSGTIRELPPSYDVPSKRWTSQAYAQRLAEREALCF